VHHHYSFQIQRLSTGHDPRFQLKVGMLGEHPFEFIPVHQTAFAKRMELAVCHTDEWNAQIELSGLLELIQARTQN
jgi:hypothetical protein